jgi:hypothetical protein
MAIGAPRSHVGGIWGLFGYGDGSRFCDAWGGLFGAHASQGWALRNTAPIAGFCCRAFLLPQFKFSTTVLGKLVAMRANIRQVVDSSGAGTLKKKRKARDRENWGSGIRASAGTSTSGAVARPRNPDAAAKERDIDDLPRVFSRLPRNTRGCWAARLRWISAYHVNRFRLHAPLPVPVG